MTETPKADDAPEPLAPPAPEPVPVQQAAPASRARPKLSFDPSSWTLDRVIAVLASIGALAAMAASVRSCQVSEQQAVIAQQNFERSQQLMLFGTFDEAVMWLTPVDANHLLQTGYVELPGAITDRAFDIGPGGQIEAQAAMERLIGRYLAKETGVKPGHRMAGRFTVPVLVWSYYTVSGEPRDDASVYWLEFAFDLTGGNAMTKVSAKNLIFATRLGENVMAEGSDAGQDLRAELDSLFVFETSLDKVAVVPPAPPIILAPDTPD